MACKVVISVDGATVQVEKLVTPHYDIRTGNDHLLLTEQQYKLLPQAMQLIDAGQSSQ